MDKNIMIAYTEVDEILNLMEEEFQKKIPVKLRNLISENKLNDYNIIIDPNIPLKEQKISRKALAILAVLNYNYWCIGEENKEKLIEKYKNNENNRQEKLRVQYNSNTLFKNNTKILNNNFENKQLIVYDKKEKFLIKIINKIKRILKIDIMFKK